jgi:hypothetical protein
MRAWIAVNGRGGHDGYFEEILGLYANPKLAMSAAERHFLEEKAEYDKLVDGHNNIKPLFLFPWKEDIPEHWVAEVQADFSAYAGTYKVYPQEIIEEEPPREA